VIILIAARLVGGIGQAVNQPVHSSLLADWHPPVSLSTMFTIYLVGSTGVGLLGSPLAGAFASIVSWRFAFVVLAIPTVIFVALMSRLREPARGQSTGTVAETEERV